MTKHIGAVELNLAKPTYRQIQLYTESMWQILGALESGDPSAIMDQHASRRLPFFSTPITDVPVDLLNQYTIDTTFLNIMRSMADFWDLLIGAAEIAAGPLVAKRDIRAGEDFIDYINQEFSDRAVAVGRNKKLSAPAKIAKIGGLSESMTKAMINLIEARRILEHHKGMAEKDFDFGTLAHQVYVDGRRTDALPQLVRPGMKMTYEIAERWQPIARDTKLELTELDVDQVGFTLRHHVIPLQVAAVNEVAQIRARELADEMGAGVGEAPSSTESPVFG